MRIRLYINRNDRVQPPGLYYGKKQQLRVSDDIWQNDGVGENDWTPVWHQFYNHDKASSSDPWYSLDINKFAVLT